MKRSIITSALACLALLAGCSGDYEPEAVEAEGDNGGEARVFDTEGFWTPEASNVDAGAAQDIEKSRFDESYGISAGSLNRQFRCVRGQSGDCMIPLKKKINVFLKVDGVPLDADRTMWLTAVKDAISRANLPDTGFEYKLQNGCIGDFGCVSLRVQAGVSGAPAGLAADDIRKYVSYAYFDINDMGTHATFRSMNANMDWVALKAYRGDSTCTSSPSGDTCYNGMIHLALNALSAVSGTGITTNASATGKGNDRDVDGNTGVLSATGDICRQRDYDERNPGEFAVDPDACSL